MVAPLLVKSSLEQLLNDGVIDEVLGQLKTGKEAEVWMVRRAEDIIAAKVYLERHERRFRNNAAYVEGRQVRNTRTQRAMDRGSKFGRAAAEEAWKSAEADALFKLHALGARVPQPVMFYEGVLLMELVIDPDGYPAPRLSDATVPPESARLLYEDLRGQAVRMLSADLIHGDLSPFNVLLAWNGPTIIDFPQVISAAHNNQAEFFFKRDLESLRQFFAGFDPQVRALEYDAVQIWRAYVRRELTPDFVPGPPTARDLAELSRGTRGERQFQPRGGPPGASGGRQGGRGPSVGGSPHRGPPRDRNARGGSGTSHRGGEPASSASTGSARHPGNVVPDVGSSRSGAPHDGRSHGRPAHGNAPQGRSSPGGGSPAGRPQGSASQGGHARGGPSSQGGSSHGAALQGDAAHGGRAHGNRHGHGQERQGSRGAPAGPRREGRGPPQGAAEGRSGGPPASDRRGGTPSGRPPRPSSGRSMPEVTYRGQSNGVREPGSDSGPDAAPTAHASAQAPRPPSDAGGSKGTGGRPPGHRRRRRR